MLRTRLPEDYLYGSGRGNVISLSSSEKSPVVKVLHELDEIAKNSSIHVHTQEEASRCSKLLAESMLLNSVGVKYDVEDAEYFSEKRGQILEDLQHQMNGLIVIKNYLRSQMRPNEDAPKALRVQADILNIQKELKSLSERYNKLAPKSAPPSPMQNRFLSPPPAIKSHKRHQTIATMKQTPDRKTRIAMKTPQRSPLADQVANVMSDVPASSSNAVLSKLLSFSPVTKAVILAHTSQEEEEGALLSPLGTTEPTAFKISITSPKKTSPNTTAVSMETIPMSVSKPQQARTNTAGILTPQDFKRIVTGREGLAPVEHAPPLVKLEFSPQAKASAQKYGKKKRFQGWVADSPARNLISQFHSKHQQKTNPDDSALVSESSAIEMEVKEVLTSIVNVAAQIASTQCMDEKHGLVLLVDKPYDAMLIADDTLDETLEADTSDDESHYVPPEMLEFEMTEAEPQIELKMIHREEISTHASMETSDDDSHYVPPDTLVFAPKQSSEEEEKKDVQQTEAEALHKLAVSIAEHAIEAAVSRSFNTSQTELNVEEEPLETTIEFAKKEDDDGTWDKEQHTGDASESFFELDLSLIEAEATNVASDSDETEVESDLESTVIHHADVKMTSKAKTVAAKSETAPITSMLNVPLRGNHAVPAMDFGEPVLRDDLPNHHNLQRSINLARY